MADADHKLLLGVKEDINAGKYQDALDKLSSLGHALQIVEAFHQLKHCLTKLISNEQMPKYKPEANKWLQVLLDATV